MKLADHPSRWLGGRQLADLLAIRFDRAIRHLGAGHMHFDRALGAGKDSPSVLGAELLRWLAGASRKCIEKGLSWCSGTASLVAENALPMVMARTVADRTEVIFFHFRRTE
jgi:hypothetical protein